MVEVAAQPSVATMPFRASIPSTIRPGNRRQAARTSGGSFAAAEPRITRATPASSQASIAAMVRIPPPSCTGMVTERRIARTAVPFRLSPATAPSRSTTCSQENPASAQARAWAAGSSA